MSVDEHLLHVLHPSSSHCTLSANSVTNKLELSVLGRGPSRCFEAAVFGSPTAAAGPRRVYKAGEVSEPLSYLPPLPTVARPHAHPHAALTMGVMLLVGTITVEGGVMLVGRTRGHAGGGYAREATFVVSTVDSHPRLPDMGPRGGDHVRGAPQRRDGR
jgi:hypothetical protein